VPVDPVEYEADTRYDGAPTDRHAVGGRTVRRLLQAIARDTVFEQWATSPAITQRLHQLLGPRLAVSQAHHNCVMTKHPAFSSATGWHQDMRYWSFNRPELISTWLALGGAASPGVPSTPASAGPTWHGAVCHAGRRPAFRPLGPARDRERPGCRPPGSGGAVALPHLRRGAGTGTRERGGAGIAPVIGHDAARLAVSLVAAVAVGAIIAVVVLD